MSQNRGCLHSLLSAFGLAPKRRKKTRTIPRSIATAGEASGIPATVLPLPAYPPQHNQPQPLFEELPYRTRDDFLSRAELSLYHILLLMVKDQATICPKVGLAEIFFVARPNENMPFYNRINQKHVDFLLCEPKSMKPILAIELDDASHERPERQARDEFVEEIFNTADLPLLRIPARFTYNTNELAAKLAEYFGAINTDAGDGPTKAPDCPKCGIPMVIRVTRWGRHQGKKFYGCQNYPKCHEILQMDELM